MAREPSAAPRRALSCVLSLSAIACTSWFLIASGRSAPARLESSGDYIAPGSCGVSTFMSAMACQKDRDSPACCGGMHNIFNARCPCAALPGIVLSHGGSNLRMTDSMIRCGFSEGVDRNGDPMPPVEYVTEALGCVDRKEWCADKLHNVDVRLTRSHKGHVQIHDGPTNSWAYARVGDLATRDNVASAVCLALGYKRVDEGMTGSVKMGAVHASKAISCPTPTSSIAACTVQDIPLQADSGFFVQCGQDDEGNRPENCLRLGGSNRAANALMCERVTGGVEVQGHVRRPGAAHTVCGTAGVNESRIAWHDGFQDDFFAYVARRSPTGQLLLAERWFGPLAGADLLTKAELEMGDRRAVLHDYLSAERKKLMAEEFDEIMHHGSDADWDW